MNITENGQRKGIAVIGFLITFLMIMILISNAIIISVKTTILSGSDINEVIENTNIYGALSEMLASQVSSSVDNGDEGAESEGGFSKEAIEAVFSEDVLKNVSETLTDAIKNEENVDLSEIKDSCMTTVEDIANNAVDEFLDEINNSTNIVDIESISNSETIKKLELDYNVDVSTVISDYVENNYEGGLINLEQIELDKVKKETKNSIKENVIPTIEESIDEYIVEVNEKVNEKIQEANDEYNISGVIGIIEMCLNLMTIIMIAAIIVLLVFAAVELFIVYRGCMNRGFRNISIAGFFSGIIIVIMSIIFGIVKSIVVDSMGGSEGAAERVMTDIIVGNIGAIADRLRLVGIIYVVMGVACLIAAVVIKAKKIKKDEIVI